MKNQMIKILSFILCFSILTVSAQDITSEVVNISAEDNHMLIEVAKKYPEVKFSKLKDPNRIVIELLNSKYHENFHFGIPVKSDLLASLLSVVDASIGESTEKPTKVSIVLNYLGASDLLPKIVSTKDNIVKISFVDNKAISENITESKKTEEDILTLYNEAVGEYENGNLDSASSLYKKVVSLDSNFYLAWINLAQIYSDKEQHDDSISILESLLKDLNSLSTDSFDKKIIILVNNALGTTYYLKGSYDKALKCFASVLEEDSLNYQALYNLALVYEKLGEIKEAKKSLEQAIELKPDFAPAQYHLGVLNLISKKGNDAVIAFKKVIEILPDGELAELSRNELDKLEKK